MQKPWYKSAIGRFRFIAICEGISFLVLLFIAMPLKYFADNPEGVLYVGWIHGILFIAYLMAGLDVTIKHAWSFQKVSIAVIASVIPFGTFMLDKRILSKEIEQ